MTLSLHTRPFFFAACLLLAGRIEAAPPKVHLTTDTEFVGVWRSIPVPLNQQPAESQARPFLRGECNYVVNGANNQWALVEIESVPGNEQKVRECKLTVKEVTDQAALLPDNLRFRWEHKDALFRTIRQTGTGGFIWSVQTVEGEGNIAVDAQAAGVELKAGDLVMQMANRDVNKVLWRLVLRRVEH